MLTFKINPQQLLTITWSLKDGFPTDLTDFTRSIMFDEKLLPSSCIYTITGERSVSFLEWRSLITSLTTLLDRGLPIKFICTSKKIYDWLLHLGFALVGEVILEQ